MKAKKTAFILLGGLLALLALLGFFVAMFNNATLQQMPSHNPVANHLETFVLLAGLALVCSVGAFGLSRLWKKLPKSFAYHIGLRLVFMGALVGYLAGLADFIGIGAHHQLPYFGPLQTAGVFLGEALIAAGFLCMFPW